MSQFVLASGSPRRRQLLSQLGLAFVVRAPDVDETLLPDEAADRYVRRVAELKAATVADQVVLAADTTVVLNGAVMGKPADPVEAEQMLARLSGQTHVVFSGVSTNGPAGLLTEVVRTEVTMAKLSADQIAWYVATGEPLDKAGAYGMQGIGMALVAGIVGSVSNVIGLPLDTAIDLLGRQGVEVMRA
ncbi:MAG: Maf family protein [Acidimicrobiia bacterium]|nr:Maf family protein [Acidimicrobiia bacterium]